MIGFTEEAFSRKLKSIYDSIFPERNLEYEPFPESISESISERRLLYRYHYQLSRDDETASIDDNSLVYGLVSAAEKVGDIGCYLSLRAYFMSPFEFSNPNRGRIVHWYIPFSEFIKVYLTLEDENLVKIASDLDFYQNSLDYRFYSPQAKWGIALLTDGMGYICGSADFMAEIRRFVPDLDEQIYYFLAYCKHLSDHHEGELPDWVLGCLKHLYGQEIGEQIFQDAPWEHSKYKYIYGGN